MTVYVDMDGVLADFESKAIEILGGDDWKEEIEKPNWGRLSAVQNLYEILEPMPDMMELWSFLEDRFGIGHQIEILTAIPKRAHFPDAVNHKRDWIHRHIGPHVRVNFGPYAYDKQFYCKLGDVLIDDSEMNVDQWNARAGRGILHTSAANTIATIDAEDAFNRQKWFESFIKQEGSK